jgi:hypothetical protein
MLPLRRERLLVGDRGHREGRKRVIGFSNRVRRRSAANY